METVDATIVFLPRFTTLVGNATDEFTTLPLDVSKYSGVQFQIWRGPMSAGTFTLKIEESLDANTWVLGPSTPDGIELNNDETKFISYSFRLRWFRLKITLGEDANIVVSCWAEGLLRGGGGGVWGPPRGSLPSGETVGGVVTPPQPERTKGPAAQEGARSKGGVIEGLLQQDLMAKTQEQAQVLLSKLPPKR